MPQTAESLPGVGLLPPTLDTLLNHLQGATARNVLIRGFGSACADNDHVLEDWVTGKWRAPARVGILTSVSLRDLVLRVCVLCEMVQVRDRTKSSATMRNGGVMRDAPDIHLGWYSGVRRNRRTYT